jgi:hypothetical protein
VPSVMLNFYILPPGTDKLISQCPALLHDSELVEAPCSKNTGLTKKLRKWSRGHQFIVRAGGHIDMWQPLYRYDTALSGIMYVCTFLLYVHMSFSKIHYIHASVCTYTCMYKASCHRISRSESPSQVFFILLHWLSCLDAPPDQPVTLAYDNMCNLDRLRVAQKPLPLPPPLDMAWIHLEKIIDKFHFPNHSGIVCRDKYSPESFKAQFPNYNTQVGEQTFAWAGRFKHILCSMSKVHHLYYLHRMITRRNTYTQKCHQAGKKPILPKKL